MCNMYSIANIFTVIIPLFQRKQYALYQLQNQWTTTH